MSRGEVSGGEVSGGDVPGGMASGGMALAWSAQPRHTGVAAALLRPDIDTDALIASRDITTPGRSGLGARLLAVWRFDAATGQPRSDFVLNREPWCRATLLLAGPNFGCGSSREMAVWALMEFGFRAVLAPSFGPIFRANALRNGLAPIELPLEALQYLAQSAEAGLPLTVDLAEGWVGTGRADTVIRFVLDDAARQALLQPEDPILHALAHEAALIRFENEDRQRRPWAWRNDRRPR